MSNPAGSRFENLPVLVYFLGKRQWLVAKPLAFTDSAGNRWTVPILHRFDRQGNHRHLGLLSDGASVPAFAWQLIGTPEGPYFPGALLHDAGYTLKTKSKAETDRMLYEACVVLMVHPHRGPGIRKKIRRAVGHTRARAIHMAVWSFGIFAWKSRKPVDLMSVTPEKPGHAFRVLPDPQDPDAPTAITTKERPERP